MVRTFAVLLMFREWQLLRLFETQSSSDAARNVKPDRWVDQLNHPRRAD